MLQLSPALKTKLSHRISPMQRMSVELLALPINDLKAAVRRELDSNPALNGSSPIVMPPMMRLASGDWVIDNAKARGRTLVEHLHSELRMSELSDRDREIAEAVACELDERGYFVGEIASIAMTLETTVEEVDRMRRRLMTFDPKGCGALDLRECLLAQIGIVPAKDRERVSAEIAAALAGTATAAEKAEAARYVKRMKPNPGKDFEYVHVEYVTPDVTVDEDGEVTVDTGDVPKLEVSGQYVDMAQDPKLDEVTRNYAREKVTRAREFAAAVQRRHETLEKIASSAIAEQREFLSQGPSALKALTMSEVAKTVGCDVSTVSRAAERKYVRTPRGTLQLRRFFTLRDAEPYEKLREIIAEAGKGAALSDRKLSERMTAAGYKMSRRTVCKWRKKLAQDGCATIQKKI